MITAAPTPANVLPIVSISTVIFAQFAKLESLTTGGIAAVSLLSSVGSTVILVDKIVTPASFISNVATDPVGAVFVKNALTSVTVKA